MKIETLIILAIIFVWFSIICLILFISWRFMPSRKMIAEKEAQLNNVKRNLSDSRQSSCCRNWKNV